MANNVGPSLNWSEEDLDRLSDPTDRDITRAKAWGRRLMPPPFHLLNDAPVFETEEEAIQAVTGTNDG